MGKLLTIALFIAACVGIFGWLFVKAGGDLPGGQKPLKARALVPTAFQLVQNADVRRAGVTIGHVRDVKNRGDFGLVEFNVDQDKGPLYKDATVRIRTKTLVGENYVDLDPGTPKAGPLGDDGVIPLAQAGEAVQLDEILSGLDARTRAAVQRNLDAFGGGFGDRGPELSRLFAVTPGTLKGVAQLSDLLKDQRPQLASMIDQTGKTLQAFANRTADVRNLSVQSQRTAAAAASRDKQLAATLAALPDTLRQLRTTSAKLGRVSRRSTPVAADLRVAMTALPAVTKRLQTSTEAGRQLFRILPSVSKQAEPMLSRLKTFSGATTDAVPSVDRFLSETNPMLRYFMPHATDLGTVFANIGSATDTRDVSSNLGRVHALVDQETLSGLPKEVYDAIDALANAGAVDKTRGVQYNAYPSPGDRTSPKPGTKAPPRLTADPTALGPK
ncbi:MlaD family protein [Patulibacter minatonensis]|uniref:MlaD family protein n=1 Tax=Patulibacter minatonensis TaxID=298163 RepID=UPI0004B3C1E8|nr:MlaD family protein [Patulibacter minatonensis]